MVKKMPMEVTVTLKKGASSSPGGQPPTAAETKPQGSLF
jgi:hypothetical protein